MMASVGLLIIRLVFGLTFAGHGVQKLFGWFGGHGLAGTAGWMESIGLKPGKAMAFAAGASELVVGILFALGLWTPLAALLMAVPMIIAILKVHGPNGYWVTKNGYEYNLAIIAVAAGVALIGPGQYALDTMIFG
jgi:putative oxidoreductase